MLAGTLATMAQVANEERPYIEISGNAELKVIPNQIFIQISLMEGTDKSKKEIEEQEKDLKAGITKAGLDLTKLVVLDASAYYGKVSIATKDVIQSKLFEFEAADAAQTTKLFAVLEELNIKNARITRVDHTDKEKFKKDVRIMAIKAAQEKANYLVEAIGQELGAPFVITENAQIHYASNRGYTNFNANKYMDEKMRFEDFDMEESLSFRKITFTANIYTKWLIK